MKSILFICAALAFPIITLAGPGHDHGDDHATDASSSPKGIASPRFVMNSELFEAVGIVKGKNIEIYVNHAKTNAPVENATMELELDGNKVPVELNATGEFDAVLPEKITKDHSESPISVNMTITTGDQVNLLAGELTLNHSDEHKIEEATHSHLSEFGLYGLGGLFVLVLTIFGYRWNKKCKQTKEGKSSC